MQIFKLTESVGLVTINELSAHKNFSLTFFAGLNTSIIWHVYCTSCPVKPQQGHIQLHITLPSPATGTFMLNPSTGPHPSPASASPSPREVPGARAVDKLLVLTISPELMLMLTEY